MGDSSTAGATKPKKSLVLNAFVEMCKPNMWPLSSPDHPLIIPPNHRQRPPVTRSLAPP